MRGVTALCPVHVGREQERAAVSRALTTVADGGPGRLLLVAGEAGLGKTRLVAEAQTIADEVGLGRLLGQCTQQSSVPYAPFVTAFRRRTRMLDPAALAELFSGPTTLAAALLPEVAEGSGARGGNPAAEDLFAAVWQLLRRLVTGRGLLLVLEDIHWADPDTLHLLDYLTRELADLPVCLLATYRPDELHRRHPLTALLSDLGRERRYDEIRLRPLDREATRDMVSAIFDGTEVGEEFIEMLVARTEGNPFFVEETAKVLVDRGDIYHEGDDWVRRDLADIEMPLTVRETLLARVGELPSGGHDVLTVAALAGDRIDLRLLEAVTEMPGSAVEEIVREALRLQILMQTREGAASYVQFRHALGREAFADEFVEPDRRRVHGRIADALTALHANDLDEVAAEIADHFAAAGARERASEFALRTARLAAASVARDEAARRYEQALSLLGPDDSRRLDLLIEAAQGTFHAADRRASVAFANEARELAQRSGDAVGEARALLVLEDDRWHAGDTPGGLDVLREALRLVEGRDEWLEALVLRVLARRLVLADQPAEAAELIERGIPVAIRAGHLAALAGLYGSRAMTTPFGPAFEAAYEEQVTAARQSGDLEELANALNNNGYARVWFGDLRRARTMLAEAHVITMRSHPWRMAYVQAGLAWVDSMMGDYDAAFAAADPLRNSGDIPARLVAQSALMEIAERRTGDTGPADEMWLAAEATGEGQRVVPALAARAKATLHVSGLDEAASLFWMCLERTTNVDERGSHWMFSPEYASALARAGAERELARWLDAIEALTANDPIPYNQAAMLLCRGYLATVRLDGAAARSAFADAAAGFAAMPCPAREIECHLGLSSLEWSLDDAPAALAAATAARNLAVSIGADVLVAEADAAVERTQSAPILATVLFTDIVGSTERVAALGDRAWGELLHRYYAVVRRELERAHGHEVDTAGDGFLATFDRPVQGVRCALAIRTALDGIGVQIRAGLHTGECQESGGKLSGLALHIASRVSSASAPGEVLVSQTVRDLVVGSGLAFEDRGARELKGVPDEWRLFAVTS